MTDQNYWNQPASDSMQPEPPAATSSQPTQAFQSGTTDTMPPVNAGNGVYEQSQSGVYTHPQPQYQPQPQPQQKQPAYQYNSNQTVPKKGSSPFKTFVFGFLGALLACALAFGGFMAWQNGQRGAASTTPSVENESTVTSKDQSVINAIDEGQTLAEAVAAKALPSVVYIGVYSSQANMYGMFGYGMGNQNSNELTEVSLGSGIVLSEDGYILTNYHVIEGAEALKVTIEGTQYDADIIGSDPSSDLAVIQVKDATNLTPADIGDSDQLVVGEWVMSVGCPFGLEQSVATGVVSATSRSRIVDNSANAYGMGYGAAEPTIYPNMIQTDAAINPGNSGGALVDADGKVIGVNTLIASYSGNYSGVGFAIPINYAINIADQIIEGKTPTHARLGVSLTDVTASIAKRYNLSSDYGAYVTEVSADSGADAAGIQQGDIIIELDGEKVSTATDLTLDIREHNPGDVVSIKVNREGEIVELSATLGSDEEAQAALSQSPQNGNGQQNPYGGNGGYDEEYSYEELLRYLGLL